MTELAENIRFKKGTYYVRVQVPKDVRHVLGKSEFWETCKTGDKRAAERVAPALIAKFKSMIERARLQGAAADRLPLGRAALAAWVAHEQRYGFGPDSQTHTDYVVVQSVEAYQKAWEEPTGYLEIPGFDRALAAVLTAFGCPAKEGDPVVAEIRQEAALTFMYALKARERARLSHAHLQSARDIADSDLDGIAVFTPAPEPALPPPARKLSALYADWIAWKKPSAKDRPILDNRYRRLIEFMGDRPINHVKKSEVSELMALVVQLPAAKRSKEEAKLTIRELVAHGTAKTLTAKTVARWYSTYRQMYEYAISKGWIESNPFTVAAKYVVDGRESTERRAYEESELQAIFSAPLFNGSDGSDAHRSVPGDKLVKDAKYWLPILSLLTGGRMGECANMRLAEVKNLGDVWYFDLSGRKVGKAAANGSDRVKTKNSIRQIPFHPKLRELGFIAYVERRGEEGGEWLFPDLAHDTKTGAATQFSRWWAAWMDKHGLPSPEITHHSWRHTFKRYARVSPVKEELHDILSGHKAQQVSRRYGEGAPIQALAKEMGRIKFPCIPALP